MAAFSISCTIQGKTCTRADCTNNRACTLLANAKGHTTDPYTYTPVTNCHAGLYLLGAVGRAFIYIGREAAVTNQIRGRPEPVKLIINCAADNIYSRPSDEPEGIVMGNKAAKALLGDGLFTSHPPVPQIGINWPDFGSPPMDRSWWVRLNAALSNIDGDVILHCFGGHGRSGTAAAILASLNGWCGEKDPVLWLREVYCNQVVETDEQIIYIEEMIGKRLTAKSAELPPITGTKGQWKATSPKGNSPKLSLRKWRAYVRVMNAKGHKFPTVDEMTKQGLSRIVVYHGEWFRFDPDKRTFTFVPPAPST